VAFFARFGIGHVEAFKRIEDNLGDDQPGVLFVVGGNDIPGYLARAGRAEAFLIRQPVILPESPLLNVGETEFPVLSGSSMRARKRFRCSSFDRWRKNLTMGVLLAWRCFSKSTIER